MFYMLYLRDYKYIPRLHSVSLEVIPSKSMHATITGPVDASNAFLPAQSERA